MPSLRSSGLDELLDQQHRVLSRSQALDAGSRRYLDNLYEDYRLGVELDGAAAHPVAERWRDIHRDNSLTRLRIEILRYNWSDVTTRRCGVAAEVADVLAQRGWPGPVRRCSPGCRAAS
jgi:very-short-patch-repair endonuclease